MRRWWPGRAHGQAGADCAPEIPFAVVREAKQDLSDIGDDVFPGFVRQPAGRDASCVLLLSFMSARLVSRRTFLL